MGAPARSAGVSELTGEDGYTFPGVPAADRGPTPFTLGVWLKPDPAGKPPAQAVVLHQSKAPVDAGSRGFELVLEVRPAVRSRLAHFWPGNAVRVRAVAPDPGRHLDPRRGHPATAVARAAGLRLFRQRPAGPGRGGARPPDARHLATAGPSRC